MTATSYSPPGFAGPIDLDLSRNEGRAPALASVDTGAPDPLELARYPTSTALQRDLAALYGVMPAQLLVTAGADDALLRCCLATLEPGAEAIAATPTFEMIPRYVALARATLRPVPWRDRFPTDACLAAANERTRLLFVVSPNNPTGAIAEVDDLRRLAQALPAALIVLDAAYAEFGDDDLPAAALALALPNVVVLRTLSKAWSLAGLRIGCAIGAPALVERLRASGNPMPVSALSLRCARRRLAGGGADLADHVAAIRAERRELTALLRALGANVLPSSANFVFVRGVDPGWLTGALAALGIAIRRFPDRAELADAVRIGLPGEPAAFDRLARALRAALAPEGLLFDMDGVLADVSQSYRAAIVATAASFGAEVTSSAIAAAKARGDANDDWRLTQELMAARGVERPLASVTERFESFYRDFRERERPLLDVGTLRRWGERYRLAVVTGRPRADAEHFLTRFGLDDVFATVVAREDAALKPDPAPVRLALQRLGVTAAWMLGDTADDRVAAQRAGVVPIQVGAPDDRAATTLTRPDELERLLR
ncbi:MAG: aminotransferase class I/II-fold pyridoxal phosphate-dependent enzyme [Planctomycetes bacterium]|nr:aminotransferase class I/II-fold pyridoxal phosphate-dependent enzyme [Planctomycetota bacterium]